MKKLFFAFFLFSCGVLGQSVTIDPKATTNGSAIIKAQSTTAGTLVPNVNSSQRTLIALPPKGLLVFDTDTGTFWFHNGTDWAQLVGGTSYWTPTNGASNLLSNYPTFTLGGGTNTTGLLSGAGSDGTLRVFSPGSITANRYMNLDGLSIQARRVNDLTGVKTENNLLLNPFGGNVGIGLTSPNAPLQFASTSGINRKIVLFEDSNNNHQFYGFGINDGLLRYQSSIGGDHVFYSAIGASSSKELMRVKYDGNVKVSDGIYSNLSGNLNIIPLGVVEYKAAFALLSSGDFTTDGGSNIVTATNILGNMAIGSIGHYHNGFNTADYLNIKIDLSPTIVNQYTKIIAFNTLNCNAEGGFGLHGSITRQSSLVSNDKLHFVAEIAVDDFPNDGFFIESGEISGSVIFYGIK